MAPIRKPVRVLSQPQKGIKSAKLHRTLRFISASVDQGVNSEMTVAARQATPVTAQNRSNRKISGNWPGVSTHADPNKQVSNNPKRCNNFVYEIEMSIRWQQFLFC
jgi:hypothetical protein